MREAIKQCRRIVVKIGTSSLMTAKSAVDLNVIDRLAFAMSALDQAGYEMVLVTSGAIGVGMAQMQVKTRPKSIARQQALAAIGQSELMRLYVQRFQDYGTRPAQLLLTHDVFDYPVSATHVLDTMNALLAANVIPVINENDSVAVDELDHRTTFGDNDQLSALVATHINADLLIVLSDIDGLYSANPREHPDAALVPHVTEMTPSVLASAEGAGTQFGTGGMVTKLKAAALMLDAGKQMVLCNGANPRIIQQVVAGDPVGTWFAAPAAKSNG